MTAVNKDNDSSACMCVCIPALDILGQEASHALIEGSAKGRVGKRKAISAQVGFALSRMQVFQGRRVEACGQRASRRARKRGEKEKRATTRGAHARAPHFAVWTCEGRRGQNVVR